MHSSRGLCLIFLCFFYKVDHPRGECKSAFEAPFEPLGLANGRPAPKAPAARFVSVLFALGNRAARQTDLGEYRRVIAERLVHVRYDLHDLAEQGALAIVNDFGDEIGADRLTIGVELDFAVGRIEFNGASAAFSLD